MKIKTFLDDPFLAPNTIGDWLLFGGILLVAFSCSRVIAWLFTRLIFRFLGKKEKEEIGFEKLFALVRKPAGVFVMLLAFYIAARHLTFPPEWKLRPPTEFGLRMVLERFYGTVLCIAFTWILLRLADFVGVILMYRAERTVSKTDDQLVPFFREAIKVVLVILSFFFILGSVFHVNVASLIAGLGIGGLAVALAAKESIENLLASFTIFLDKPFSVGDQVQVGTIAGTVERIGFRSTRLRTEEKSYLTVPNKKMVDTEVNNLSLRPQRRVQNTLHLSHATSAGNLQSLIAELQALLDAHPVLVENENRVRLFEFTASSANVLIIYFIKEIDYDVYLNVRQEINFRILQAIEKNGAEFATPVTVVSQK